MKNCSVFASLISPSKMILFEKKIISNIRHSVSSPDETPRSSSKILRCASYLSTLFSVFHLVMKHCVSCLIYYFFVCLFVFFSVTTTVHHIVPVINGRLKKTSFTCVSQTGDKTQTKGNTNTTTTTTT